MKKIFLSMTTAASIAISPFAHAGSCETEKQLIGSLKIQLSAIDSELSLAKTNRNATAVSGIGSLIFLYTNLKTASGVNRQSLIFSAAVGAAAAGLGGYNVYLAQKDVSFYQEMSEFVRQSLEDKEAEVRLDLCLSDKVQKSRNEKAQALFNDLVNINQALQIDIEKLDKELGNIGTKVSAYVSVGASILLVGGGVMQKASREGGAMLGVGLAAIGAITTAGSQTMNLPSLIMSAKEARVLLAETRKVQKKLKTQEELLRGILN